MNKNNDKKYFDFVEKTKMNLSGFTLIEGFPDVGLAGTIGARYLSERLGFETIGHVDSVLFSPIIRITNGVPMHPVRIYASKKYKTVILLAEQIIPNNIAGIMAKEIVEWIKLKKIKQVIATSGIKSLTGNSVYAFASDENSKKIIKKHNLELIENGVTSGVTAMMMLYLKDNNIVAYCLIGNARNNADYYAAAEIVKAFCKIINVSIDVKPLLKEAKILEEAITQHLKTLQTQKKADDEPEILKGTPMYT
ncbi:MAG: PAC2 family protein [Candidatus ainarchaeum sp.]|nr:PAC2 family protein [Candidatus ainarchaeum sp.]